MGVFKGIPCISFGIMEMPYNEKELIQMASYYYAGKQYEKYDGCMFYSGSYNLIPFTEELNIADLMILKGRYNLDEEEIKRRYKYVFVNVVDVK